MFGGGWGKGGGCTRTGTHPWFEGREAQAHSDGGFVWVHYRVIVYVTVVADSDWLVIVLMDTMERVDWF